MAKVMSEITAFVAAFLRRAGSEETLHLEQEWLRRKTDELLTLAEGDEAIRTKALRYIEGVRQMDRLGTNTDEGQKLWGELWKGVKKDLDERTD